MIDSQEIVQRIKAYQIPLCSIDELHENLNQICVDVKCDQEKQFQPLCTGCIEDKHHTQNMIHQTRQLKRVLLDIYKETQSQGNNLGNFEAIQEKLSLLATSFDEIGQFCFTVSDQLKEKVKEITEKSKDEQNQKKSIQKILDDLLNKPEEEFLKSQLKTLKEGLKLQNEKIQVNNEKFDQEWRALVQNTNKQIRVCEQLVARLTQSGIVSFDLNKCQNTPLPTLQQSNLNTAPSSDELQQQQQQQQVLTQQQQQQPQSVQQNQTQPSQQQQVISSNNNNNYAQQNQNPTIPIQQSTTQSQQQQQVQQQQNYQPPQQQIQQPPQQHIQQPPQQQIQQPPQQQIQQPQYQNQYPIQQQQQQPPPQQVQQQQAQINSSYIKNDQSFVQQEPVQIGFSQILKSPSIVVIDKKIAKQTETSYETNRVALIEPVLSLAKKSFFAFQVISQTGWMGVGIARKKVVMENQYGFKYEDSKNGQYMISSNGYKWVHNNDAENGQQISFSFQQYDILLCEFDPINKRLRFKKKGSDKMALIQVDIQLGDDDEFYMSVNLSDKDDSIGMFIDDKTEK